MTVFSLTQFPDKSSPADQNEGFLVYSGASDNLIDHPWQLRDEYKRMIAQARWTARCERLAKSPYINEDIPSPEVNYYLDCGTSKFETKIPKSVERISYEYALSVLTRGREDFKVKYCDSGQTWARLKCQNPKCAKVIDVPTDCCDSALCPECRRYYAKKKATEATQRIKPFGAGRFTRQYDKETGYPYSEFTVPEQYYNLFLKYDQVNLWYAVIRDTIREWYGCEVGGVQLLHTHSSKKYWKWQPHIPIQLAGIGYSEDRGWFALRLFRHPWEISILKAIYTRRMKEAFNIKQEHIKTKDGFIDVHYQYCKSVPELGERLQYSFRYPSPGRRIQGWEALAGLDSKQILGIASQFLWLRGFRRVRWFGFLATRRGKWLCEQLKVKLRDWHDELNHHECPYCGGYLKFEGFISNAERAPPEC